MNWETIRIGDIYEVGRGSGIWREIEAWVMCIASRACNRGNYQQARHDRSHFNLFGPFAKAEGTSTPSRRPGCILAPGVGNEEASVLANNIQEHLNELGI